MRYAVLNESGEVDNIIVLDPDTADEFAATSGLAIRPATGGDVIPIRDVQTSGLSSGALEAAGAAVAAETVLSDALDPARTNPTQAARISALEALVARLLADRGM